MKRILLISVYFPAPSSAQLGASASAQTDTTPTAGNPPVVVPTTPASHGGGARIGVGGIAYLSGQSGISVAFDPGSWHLDTMLGLSGGDGGGETFMWVAASGITCSARPIRTCRSEAAWPISTSRGNGAGPGAVPAANNLFIEFGGLIRIFLVQNVALGVGAGMVVGTADASGYNIGGGTLVGNASVHYYF